MKFNIYLQQVFFQALCKLLCNPMQPPSCWVSEVRDGRCLWAFKPPLIEMEERPHMAFWQLQVKNQARRGTDSGQHTYRETNISLNSRHFALHSEYTHAFFFLACDLVHHPGRIYTYLRSPPTDFAGLDVNRS